MALTLPLAKIRIARDVANAESAIARAMVDVTALAHSAALAEAEIGGASPTASHMALKSLHASLGGLIEVRANMQRCHGALRDIARETATTEEPNGCPPMAIELTPVKVA